DLARDVTAQSDGNPFFAEQLVLYLHEQGLLSATAAGWQRDPAAEQDTAGQILSGDVRTVLTARLDRLDPELRRSVQMASVLGREFDTRLLAAMVEETMPAAQTPIAHVLAAGRKARLWSAVDESAADVRYLFRHELLRSTAYDMQLRARLRGLHARAAAAIATVFGDELAPRYADLAYHHRRAEQPAEERHFAALAGRYAADQFANRDAMRHLERALALLDPDDAVNKFELLLLHEQVADTSGDRTRQRADVDALLQVAAQLAQPARLGQALLRAGHHARVTNDHAGAVGQLTAALDLAQADDDPRLTVACFNGLGKVEWRRHRYDAAEQHLIAALARAEVDAHLAADSVYHLGLVDYSRGKLDAANARFDAALTRFIALGDRKGEAMALSMIGAVEYRLGRYDHAVTIAEQGLEAADAIGWTYLRAHALASLGNSLFDLGQFDACRARHRQAVDLYRSLHDQEGEARSLDTIGLAATLLGDLAEAATHFEDAATRQREIDDGPGLAYTLSHHALALVAAGDLDGAQAALEEALALRTRLDDAAGALECRVGLADVARRRGRTDVAYAAAVALWPEFRATPVANVEAPIRVCLSLARIFQTRDDPAARAWTQAVIDYGHALLDARAAALADPAMRAGFLTAVPEHRALLDMQR
ncbi:MAG: tetratricopeptide repeat protein, partial [Caldilineaceae bacterium]|nr:tetratricopeptide repeat protein [Caldilineaceae bacterium]